MWHIMNDALFAAAESWKILGSQEDASPIMILDELDSGIGTRLGTVMGRLLQRMAATSVPQLLCVSHLPQVRPLRNGRRLNTTGVCKASSVLERRRLHGGNKHHDCESIPP